MGLIAVSAVARRGMESEDGRSRTELAHASRWPRLATRAPAQSPTHPRLPGWGQPGSHEPSWSSSPRAKPTQVRQKTGGVQSVGGGTATMPPAAVDAGRLRLNNRKGQVRCTLTCETVVTIKKLRRRSRESPLAVWRLVSVYHVARCGVSWEKNAKRSFYVNTITLFLHPANSIFLSHQTTSQQLPISQQYFFLTTNQHQTPVAAQQKQSIFAPGLNATRGG